MRMHRRDIDSRLCILYRDDLAIVLLDIRGDGRIREVDDYVALALGAALEIDACPIEGFDVKLLNDALDLRGKGFTAVALVALGYRAADDFNAALPKSRLPMDEVLSEI